MQVFLHRAEAVMPSVTTSEKLRITFVTKNTSTVTNFLSLILNIYNISQADQNHL